MRAAGLGIVLPEEPHLDPTYRFSPAPGLGVWGQGVEGECIPCVNRTHRYLVASA